MSIREFFPRDTDEVIQFLAVSFGSVMLLSSLRDPSHQFFYCFALFIAFISGFTFYSKYLCLAVMLALFMILLSSPFAGLIGFASIFLGILARFLYRLRASPSK